MCTRCLSVLLLLSLLAACGPGPTPVPTLAPLLGTIKVGAVLSPEHVPARNGIVLAEREINAEQALGPGVTLRVLFEDDQGVSETAINAVFKLINGDGVSALLGPSAPFPTEQVVPIANAARVPLINFTPGVPGLTAARDYIFRTSSPDTRVISQTVAVARARLPMARVAILYDEDDGDLRAEYLAFAAVLAAQGVTVVATEAFREGDTDFAPALGRAQAAGATTLVVIALPAEAVPILAQAAALELPVVGSSRLAAPEVEQAAGTATVVLGVPWCLCAPGAANERFVAGYRAQFGAEPNAQAAQAYSATWLLAAAMKRAGNADRKSIRDALAQLDNVDTPLGLFRFDARREPAYEPYIITVKEGKFALW